MKHRRRGQAGRMDPRLLVPGVWWGLVVGTMVLGVGGRLIMSLIAWAQGYPVEYDAAGTAQVVVLGAAMGPPGGLVYTALRDRLPAGTVVRGLVFGAINAGFWAAVYFVRPAGPIELREAPWSAVLFGGLLLGFGVGVAIGIERVGERIDRPGPRALAALGAVILSAAGAGLALFALITR